jgi:hypothetical protein
MDSILPALLPIIDAILPIIHILVDTLLPPAVELLNAFLPILNPVISLLGKLAEAFTWVVDKIKPFIDLIALGVKGVASFVSSDVGKIVGFFSSSKEKETVPAHAKGTNDFEGGWTKVNETGGELIQAAERGGMTWLPKGAVIVPATKTDKILDKLDKKLPTPICNINDYRQKNPVPEAPKSTPEFPEKAQLVPFPATGKPDKPQKPKPPQSPEPQVLPLSAEKSNNWYIPRPPETHSPPEPLRLFSGENNNEDQKSPKNTPDETRLSDKADGRKIQIELNENINVSITNANGAELENPDFKRIVEEMIKKHYDREKYKEALREAVQYGTGW